MLIGLYFYTSVARGSLMSSLFSLFACLSVNKIRPRPTQKVVDECS